MSLREEASQFFQQWMPLLSRLAPFLMGFLIICSFVLLWQISHRKLPLFTAVSAKGQRMSLTAHEDPSLLPGVLVRWASRAAVAAYTFDFVNYQKQTDRTREWFTDSGWSDYQASLAELIQTITARQLFVNGVISAPPVIVASDDTSWNIQLPFLVTYQSSDQATRQSFIIKMKIVRVSTMRNPSGLGVAEFVMASSG